jgi:hypothetical protein
MWLRRTRNKEMPDSRRRLSRAVGGNRQPPTFSYYSSQTVRQSQATPEPRRAEERSSSSIGPGTIRKAWAGRVPLLLGCAVVVICLIKLASLSTSPKVVILNTTAISSLYTRPTATYQAAASQLFRRSLANHLKLTVDNQGIARALQQQFPELHSVSVAIPVIGNRPTVYIAPAQPSAFLQTKAGDILAINQDGVALASVPVLPAKATAPLLIDQSLAPAGVGKQVLSSSTVAFAQAVAFQLRQAKQPAATMTLPADNPYELDLTLQGKNFIVKYNLQRDAAEQAGTMLAVLQHLGATTPGAYIDVRVPGRAYYQ